MYERILQLFNESKKGDYPLEKEIGLAQGSIKNWRNNKSKPSTEAIIKIANYFNVTTDYLLDKQDSYNPPADEVLFFPTVGTIRAGYGDNIEEIYTGEETPVPKYLLRGDPKNYFVLRVCGDSMTPLYQEGDCVLMHRTNYVDSGQTAAVSIGGEEATLKRVIYDEKRNFITLEALNPHYSPRTFHKEDMNEIRILGEVKHLFRKVY